jgi:YARHG domain-containing protein
MRGRIVVIAILFLTTVLQSSAFCDEALLKVYGGGLKYFDGKSTAISMESETVKIELQKKTYTVDATSIFFNPEKTSTVKVGFPKSGHGYSGNFKGVDKFINFEIWVNDTKSNIKELSGEMKLDHQKMDDRRKMEIMEGKAGGWLEETRWLVKDITFKEKEKTTIRVRYTAPYDEQRNGNKFAEYLYGAGSSWQGSIGKADFIIKVSPELSLFWVQFAQGGVYKNIRKFAFQRLGEYEFKYSLTNIKPKEDERLRFLANSTWEPWDGPDFRIQLIERERLELLSFWQLKIVRNSIYAMHGKIFKDSELDKYFRQFNWYKPRQDFKESDLNNIEKENVSAISKYESELRATFSRR